MEIYLDNAATTKPYNEVVDGMVEVLTKDYGNPSSLHKMGLEAEKKIKESRKTFGKILGCTDKEILFTSGGTESNNLAILGACKALRRRGKHIITSAIEHPAVLNVFEHLEKEEGYDVTIVPVNEDGIVDLEYLLEAVREDTVLVSIMHVNNEVGGIQPIDKIGQGIKARNSETLFHVDAIQSFGKLPIHVRKYKIDLLSISGHKIHGPKGVGVLYVNQKSRILPIVHGGGQQLGIRSGTENVPGIVGIKIAAEKMYGALEINKAHIGELKAYLLKLITDHMGEVVLNGNIETSSHHILNISFLKVKSEVLLHTLEENNIYVSSGSACSSNKPQKSKVLLAMAKSDDEIDSAIRFSFSEMNTKKDIDLCFEMLKQTVPMLRRFVKR